MWNVQRDWLPMGIIKSIQCSFVIKHVFWHRKLTEHLYTHKLCIDGSCIYMYACDITFGEPNVFAVVVDSKFCVSLHLYWWSWKRWQIKRNNNNAWKDGISGTKCWTEKKMYSSLGNSCLQYRLFTSMKFDRESERK